MEKKVRPLTAEAAVDAFADPRDTTRGVPPRLLLLPGAPVVREMAVATGVGVIVVRAALGDLLPPNAGGGGAGSGDGTRTLSRKIHEPPVSAQ